MHHLIHYCLHCYMRKSNFYIRILVGNWYYNSETNKSKYDFMIF